MMITALWIALSLVIIAAIVGAYTLGLRTFGHELKAQEVIAEKERQRATRQQPLIKTHFTYIAGPSRSGKSTLETGLSSPIATASQLGAMLSTRREKLSREILLGLERTEDGETLHTLKNWDSAGESPATVMNALLKGAEQSSDGERAVAIWVLSLADIEANHQYFTRGLVDVLWGNDRARKLFKRFVVILNKEDVVRERMSAVAADKLVEAEQQYVRKVIAEALGGGYEIEFARGSALTGLGMREAWGAVIRALELAHLYETPVAPPAAPIGATSVVAP